MATYSRPLNCEWLLRRVSRAPWLSWLLEQGTQEMSAGMNVNRREGSWTGRTLLPYFPSKSGSWVEVAQYKEGDPGPGVRKLLFFDLALLCDLGLVSCPLWSSNFLFFFGETGLKPTQTLSREAPFAPSTQSWPPYPLWPWVLPGPSHLGQLVSHSFLLSSRMTVSLFLFSFILIGVFKGYKRLKSYYWSNKSNSL